MVSSSISVDGGKINKGTNEELSYVSLGFEEDSNDEYREIESEMESEEESFEQDLVQC